MYFPPGQQGYRAWPDVDEKPETRPVPVVETLREWLHPDSGNIPCQKPGNRYLPTDTIPGPCDDCGADGWFSKGIVDRDANNGTIYRRNGKSVPIEAKKT